MEMCSREGISLQKGMNFKVRGTHSVILMSMHSSAKYEDEIIDNGNVLIYEGHDIPQTRGGPYPKSVDQPEYLPSGTKFTENGKFNSAAQKFKRGEASAEKIVVYEKLRKGIWSYNGIFNLVDSWMAESNGRKVFKFKLELTDESVVRTDKQSKTEPAKRIIPSWVKLDAWKRDGGKCVQCGSDQNLHFDHIIPWSRGGASDDPSNIQILCGRHNIQKSDKIE